MTDRDVERRSGSWLKTGAIAVGGLLAIVLAKGVGSVAGHTAVDQFATGYNDGVRTTALTTGISKAVTQIRSQAPIHVDEITTLRDAMAAGNEIIYLMELKADLTSDQMTETQRALEIQNQSNVCSNDATRKLVAIGGKMTWQYTVQSGAQFRVSVASCG